MKKIKNNLINLFILSSLTSSSLSAMMIDLELGRELTQNQRIAFKEARDKWKAILLNNDLPAVEGNNGYDIVIKANAVSIDGPDGILGQSGPTRVRPNSHIPSQAIMKFDVADLENMESNGTLKNVIVHEMAHALGFGTIWSYLDLTNDDIRNPFFLGKNAKEKYRALRGVSSLSDVPLENIGGPGTAGSHWRKSIFGNELMTGSISSANSTPVSILTIAAFQDMGYRVDYRQADTYSLPLYLSMGQQHGGAYTPRRYQSPRLTSACHCRTICPQEVYYSEVVPLYNEMNFSTCSLF